MSLTQRFTLIIGALVATLIISIVFQGATQEGETQAENQSTAAEQPSFPAPSDGEFVPGEVIVGLEESATQADLAALNERTGAETEEDLVRSDVNLVDLPRQLTVEEAVERYEASPDVEYAEPNFLIFPSRTPNDSHFSKLWGLHNTGQTIGSQAGTPDADIDAPEAWNTSTGTPQTVVAVIDEGIDINHPDLRNNIWTNTDEVPANAIDDDRNGYVDDLHGYDFANDDASVYDPDPLNANKGDEHGTHVAGTIAAQANNATGVSGVNWEAQIMALKFLGPNGGRTSDAIEAINYAVANGAKISNNSWGYMGSPSRSLQDAIARADSSGHLFVAAAGNGGSDGIGDNNDRNSNNTHYPASYNNANIIAVAATDNRDRLASFSNYGATTVDLAAPGVNIASTLPGNGYGYYSGTSMATPQVTGVAALLRSQSPTLDDAQMKSAILDSADKKSRLTGKVLTNGRLNASSALSSVVRVGTTDTTDPSVSSVKPSPGTRDRTPRLTATVRDDRTDLSQGDIRFALDGTDRSTFSYDAGADRLIYDSGRLPLGKHTARITATDDAGNTVSRTWTFKVVRR
jgi:thermitase